MKNNTTNKNFGIVFFIFFLIISMLPLLNNESIRIWSIILSILFLILGIMNSSILSPLNKIWFKFGILLGRFTSPIIMAIVFFGVITPISILMKLFGKDILLLKTNTKNTYWIEKPLPESKMKNQF